MESWKVWAAGPYSATAAKPMKKPQVPMTRPWRGDPRTPRRAAAGPGLASRL